MRARRSRGTWSRTSRASCRAVSPVPSPTCSLPTNSRRYSSACRLSPTTRAFPRTGAATATPGRWCDSAVAKRELAYAAEARRRLDEDDKDETASGQQDETRTPPANGCRDYSGHGGKDDDPLMPSGLPLADGAQDRYAPDRTSRHHGGAMSRYLFRNVKLLDPAQDELLGSHEVLVEGDLIREVSDGPLQAGNATVIDGGGRTLMPGLIDCHVHVFLSELNIRNLEHVPLTLMTARAAESMRAMIDRGFTTVRDTGGADWGIKAAVESGLLAGPRLFISGRAIGPTGGHSDSRRRTDSGSSCGCCNAMVFCMALADGADEARRSAREQMRQGADQVKIMMSGGVASPYDPLDSLQYSPAEVAAVVDEARAFGRYVCAHAYSAEAITRAAHAGVRTIEHGNLIDDASARLMASKGMFLIANLVAYYEMKKRAGEYGMSSDMVAKNDLVIEGGLRSLEICKRAGVPVAYGTDLLGQLQSEQSREFIIRSEVQKPIEIIRAATLIGAQIVRQVDKIGCLKAEAFADLLVIDGNPLANLGLLQEQGKYLALIMKGGRLYKNRLH